MLRGGSSSFFPLAIKRGSHWLYMMVPCRKHFFWRKNKHNFEVWECQKLWDFYLNPLPCFMWVKLPLESLSLIHGMFDQINTCFTLWSLLILFKFPPCLFSDGKNYLWFQPLFWHSLTCHISRQPGNLLVERQPFPLYAWFSSLFSSSLLLYRLLNYW